MNSGVHRVSPSGSVGLGFWGAQRDDIRSTKVPLCPDEESANHPDIVISTSVSHRTVRGDRKRDNTLRQFGQMCQGCKGTCVFDERAVGTGLLARKRPPPPRGAGMHAGGIANCPHAIRRPFQKASSERVQRSAAGCRVLLRCGINRVSAQVQRAQRQLLPPTFFTPRSPRADHRTPHYSDT